MFEVITGDKRHFQRILFDKPVCITDGEQSFESSLVDISLNGALVKKPASWQTGRKNHFELIVKLEDEYNDITMQVHTAHEESETIGFQCDTIDLDSISCLKRLVELNLGDAELVERELTALVN